MSKARGLALGGALFLSLGLLSCVAQGSRSDLAKEYAAIGYGYYGLKKFDKAEFYFKKAIEMNAELPIGTYELARTYTENGDYKKGLELVDLLLAKDRQNTILLTLKAYCLLKLGRYAEARTSYMAVEALVPDNANAAYNLALMDIGEESFAESEARLERVIGLSEKDDAAILLLAKVKFKLEKDAEGFALLDKYDSIKERDPAALKLRAEKRALRREYALAMESYDAYLALKPGDPYAWFELSVLAILAGGEREKSLDAFKKCIENGYKEKKRVSDFLSSLSPEDAKPFNDILPSGYFMDDAGQEGNASPGASASTSPQALESPSPSPSTGK